MSRADHSFRRACEVVAEGCFGDKGRWAYRAFDVVNARYFGGRLPVPHIIWGLTPHGRSLGQVCIAADLGRRPVLTLHPSTLGGTEKENPWNVPREYLGPTLAFDVLVNGCIGLNVHYRLGGPTGETGHNSPEWVAEVNRLGPLLGLLAFRAGLTKVRRVPVEGAPPTVRGKVRTRPTRVTDGDLPLPVIGGFPYAAYAHFGLGKRRYGEHRPPEVPDLGRPG